MRRHAVLALVVAALVPAFATALPKPPDVRIDPSHVAAEPSYVQRVEPAIVGLKVHAPVSAPSSARLGPSRFASGVVFDPRGYVVTVSYALLDAAHVEAITRDDRTVPAEIVGIDHESGLGVVRLRGDGPWAAAVLADSHDVAVGDVAGTVGVDEDNELAYVVARVQGIRRFSAFWEYMIDRAFFVSPSSDSWGGSAVVDASGRVVAIASLRIGEPPYVNVAIPMERFLPVKDELMVTGRIASRPPRPWLGLYTAAVEGGVVVDGFAADGPARSAGFRRGDRIIGVNDVRVASQEEFYAALWRGRAGDVIRVIVRRDDRVRVIPVRSVDQRAATASSAR